MRNEKITMVQAGIIFTVSLVIFLAISFLNPFENFYITGVVGEILPILLPSVLGLIIMRKSLKTNLKFNKIRALDGILVMIITLFAIPLTMALGVLNRWLVNLIFGHNLDIQIPIPKTGGELLISLLVIGVVAAVCEEVLFRGVLQTSFEKLGKMGMIILVSLLFTAFHFSIEQFLGLFVLSLLITYMVYRTNSIFAGMIAHFTNNAAAMIMSFFANKIPETMIEESEAAAELVSSWAQILILGIIVAGMTAVAIGLLVVFTKRTKETKTGIPTEAELKFVDTATFIPAVMIMAGMFIVVIISYIMQPLMNGI